MSDKTPIHPADLRGFSQLTVDAIVGLTDLIEALHHNISQTPGVLGAPVQGQTKGITGLVYRSIRGVTGLVGSGLDVLLAQLVPLLGDRSSSAGLEAVLAALNGVLGDYLATSNNPLAIPMRVRREGRPLKLEKHALSEALVRPTGKLLVLAHGLCLNDLQWNRKEHDHGAALARDLGYTPVYLHYNSGRHISTNGREFASLMQLLVGEWPVPLDELAIIGHSMGGLVTRTACHYARLAEHDWVAQLGAVVFLGTPHHGAPLERGGTWVNLILGASPYTAPFARLAKIRSAGITDLRYGNLLDEDRGEQERFANAGDLRQAVPLPEGTACYAMAAILGKDAGDLSGRILGDGLVPLDSALGRHGDPAKTLLIPESRQWVVQGINHLDLLSEPQVYERIRQWLEHV